MMGIHNSSGNGGFHNSFIKYFSKIRNLFFKFLDKKAKLIVDVVCLKEFKCLKENLILGTAIFVPDQSMSFEVKWDTSRVVLEAVLGQRHRKIHHTIFYANKALNAA